MPKPAPEKMDELVKLDPDLRPDEQSYVSHYLNYADTLLETDYFDEDEGDAATPQPPTKFSNILELPTIEEPEPAPSDEVEEPIARSDHAPKNRVIPSAITSGQTTHRVHPVIGKARRRKFDLIVANSERTTERLTDSNGSQSTERMESKQNENAA